MTQEGRTIASSNRRPLSCRCRPSRGDEPAGLARAPHSVLSGIAPVQRIIAHRRNRRCPWPTSSLSRRCSFTRNLYLHNLSVERSGSSRTCGTAPTSKTTRWPDHVLRFGVQFADGRKATTLDHPPYDPQGQAADRPVLKQQGGGGGDAAPVLKQQGGGGGDAAWDMEHWLWPTATSRAIRLRVCRARKGHRGVASRDRRRLILEAAGRAVTLWPDD
jgi:hypothetical protein